MLFSMVSSILLCGLWISPSHAELHQNLPDIMGMAQDASQKHIDQTFAKLAEQFQGGGTWKDQMDQTVDDVRTAYENLNEKNRRYQEDQSSSTQKRQTVSSSSYAYSSGSYKDGEEPVTHFESGGSHTGEDCTIITKRDGNAVSTKTTCKSSVKDEI
ncbi:hypothetical protein RvY_13262 [Ramazzottius varieornatus]|uniref:Uncharacterized protein n=1 Tax=Ramazzottius varieornatus TaxID=947166 RepID=A0A1D1VMB2_RAMVA|nr:hypothetical protein RvY_13262 [Ramazzottius varieornatus]